MRRLLPNPRGLLVKLAVFFLALALPALLLVETSLVTIEFRRLVAAVDSGAFATLIDKEAADLEFAGADTHALSRALEALLLRLERPRDGWSGDESYVLLELSAAPLSAALFDAEGRPLVQTPTDAIVPPPSPDVLARLAAGRSRSAQLIASDDAPELVRRYAVPLFDHQDRWAAILMIELKLPLPWRKVLGNLSFEWPLMIAFLAVFALASAAFLSWYVTGRLQRFAAAAESWSRGELEATIADPSTDELGTLAVQLNQMADQLRARVADRTRLATLEERQRLARDLHDTVKQKAFALQLQLAVAGRTRDLEPALAERLGEARRITEEIQHELVHILDELRSPQAGDFGTRLQTRIDDWARRGEIAISTTLDALPRIDSEHEVLIERIVNEALANVVRHADAKTVGIDLRIEGRHARLSVTDDGRGGARARPGGMGLANIRQRAEQLPAGTCEIGGTAAGGTRICIQWTLPEQA